FNTTLEMIPADIPYLYIPESQDLPVLPSHKKTKTFKVGIAWAGSPTHKNDANRSCQLADFMPVLHLATQTDNLEFYSLQKGDRVSDLQQLPPEIPVHNLDNIIETYADTAAVIEQLDLVISVDTSVVHLAGALGKPVWTLLCYNPDWRWLLEREDTPWYPTMRLFRQPQPQDWQTVFLRVQQILAEQLGISNFDQNLSSLQILPEKKSGQQVGICWPIGMQSGWGTYGLNLTLELLKTTVQPILLAGIANLESLLPTHQSQLKSLLQQQEKLTQPLNFPLLCALGNQLGTSQEIEAITSSQKIGLIFFEDTYFSENAIASSQKYQAIITSSTWNYQILQQVLPSSTQLHTVFQGIDRTLFYPATKSNTFGNRFVIFSGGKLEYRKGQDIIIAAFRAFHQRHPDALLVTAWHNYWPQFMIGLDRAGHVVGLPKVEENGTLQITKWLVENGIPENAVVALNALPNAQMPQFIREADVALFTSRAEGGTNLAAMECLACGIPTILSANTGHLDLLGEHCYSLQHQNSVEPLQFATGTEGWGESSLEEVLEALENVYQNRSEAQQRGQQGAKWMQNWTWEIRVQQLLNALAITAK
ncbi:MAG: glycosyltransferase, partial [Cyanobacteriota bacterium]|nr:glycosyltransferase [Cyanobacteriota bacterium]